MEGRELATYILESLENQLLNAEASEGQDDILVDIREELEEVQKALEWIRALECNG